MLNPFNITKDLFIIWRTLYTDLAETKTSGSKAFWYFYRVSIFLMHKNIKTTVIHISGWVAYLLTVVIGAEATNKDFWVYLFSAKIPVILLFYICLYYVYPAYLGEKKYFRLTVILLLLIAFLTLLRFFYRCRAH